MSWIAAPGRCRRAHCSPRLAGDHGSSSRWSTSRTQGAGGETATSTSTGPGRTTTTICRGAPVEFEVGGQQYSGTDVVSGACVPTGDTRTLTVRYVPDDPYDFTTNGRQWILYGFAGAAAPAFLVTLVAVARRVLDRRRERREADPLGTLSP